MENILSYINTLGRYIFDIDLLASPADTISALTTDFVLPPGSRISDLLSVIIANPTTVFSTVVWVLFAVLLVKLTLVLPYKFAKAVIRKCRIS